MKDRRVQGGRTYYWNAKLTSMDYMVGSAVQHFTMKETVHRVTTLTEGSEGKEIHMIEKTMEYRRPPLFRRDGVLAPDLRNPAPFRPGHARTQGVSADTQLSPGLLKRHRAA